MITNDETLMDTTNIILDEIEDKKAKWQDIAISYAFCIASNEHPNWDKINTAIMARWDKSVPNKIKSEAHKMVHENE